MLTPYNRRGTGGRAWRIAALVVATAVLAACGGAAAPASNAPSPPIRVHSGSAQAIEPLLSDISALLPNEQAGAAVAVIDGGEPSIGFAGNPAFDENTLFEFGSLTKVFTANILMQLAGEGVVSLDDSANQYLPPETQDAKWEAVTLEQLATHTGGVPRLPPNMNAIQLILSGQGDDPYASFDEAKLLEGARRTRLDPPGEAREYSNFGYALLGLLLSRATGQSYAEMVQQRLFDPLGMDGAAVESWSSDDIAPALTVDGAPGDNWTFSAFDSAGAIKGSLTDALAFLRGSMGACQNDDAVSRANCLAQQPKGIDASNGGEMAIGWIRTQGPGGTAVWHNGGTGGYHTFLGFNPETQKGLVILSNVADLNELDSIGRGYLTGGE